MKLLGFSTQKPLYQAWQQDPVLVKQWEAETYPAIKAEAQAAGATIYFADEAGIRSDYYTHRNDLGALRSAPPIRSMSLLMVIRSTRPG